ncbi:hypothetical protein IR010_12145 [Flavobacterium sp. MR2016-29]|uniref:hypothetical protein n=1 Tax=Flavobacterium sp. MR2016-29 TaxID=2783795 RepID=UPI00188C6092|nr:hypothetical protein [Flavobacterium sp. MR2016-29]MBF4493293.1 hypothetical protein [Flavobacterium sp. MR2016-29]
MADIFKFFYDKFLDLFPNSSRKVKLILILVPLLFIILFASYSFYCDQIKSKREEIINRTPHLVKINYSFLNDTNGFYYEYKLKNTGKVPAKIKTIEYQMFGGPSTMKIFKIVPADTSMKKSKIIPAGTVYNGKTLKQGIILIPRPEIKFSVSVPPDTLVELKRTKFQQFQNDLLLPGQILNYRIYLIENMYAAKVKIDYVSDIFPDDEIKPLIFDLATPRGSFMNTKVNFLKDNNLNVSFTFKTADGFETPK